VALIDGNVPDRTRVVNPNPDDALGPCHVHVHVHDPSSIRAIGIER
jgi:hypothetical protein